MSVTTKETNNVIAAKVQALQTFTNSHFAVEVGMSNKFRKKGKTSKSQCEDKFGRKALKKRAELGGKTAETNQNLL